MCTLCLCTITKLLSLLHISRSICNTHLAARFVVVVFKLQFEETKTKDNKQNGNRPPFGTADDDNVSHSVWYSYTLNDYSYSFFSLSSHFIRFGRLILVTLVGFCYHCFVFAVFFSLSLRHFVTFNILYDIVMIFMCHKHYHFILCLILFFSLPFRRESNRIHIWWINARYLLRCDLRKNEN